MNELPIENIYLPANHQDTGYLPEEESEGCVGRPFRVYKNPEILKLRLEILEELKRLEEIYGELMEMQKLLKELSAGEIS